MPTINHAKQELLLKIVYYGCGFGGKTTNLEYIHRTSNPNHRGKLLSLRSDTERTLFFDLLPVHLGTFKGYSIRLHLCTVPGQAAFDRTRRLILRGADGIVFVVDSQRETFFDNVNSAENLEQNLRLQGLDPKSLPLVVQLNKRDLPNAATVEQLRLALEIPDDVEVHEAIATEGMGVYETLKAIVCQCLKRVGDPRPLPDGKAIAGESRRHAPVQRGSGAPAPAQRGSGAPPMIDEKKAVSH